MQLTIEVMKYLGLPWRWTQQAPPGFQYLCSSSRFNIFFAVGYISFYCVVCSKRKPPMQWAVFLHSRCSSSRVRVAGCCTVCTFPHIPAWASCMEYCHSRNFRRCLALCHSVARVGVHYLSEWQQIPKFQHSHHQSSKKSGCYCILVRL